MKWIIALVVIAALALCASYAEAEVPHVRYNAPYQDTWYGPVLSAEATGSVIFLPSSQSLLAGTATFKAAFPTKHGNNAVTYGLNLGSGWSPHAKEYMLASYDMGFIIPLFQGEFGLELGGRLLGLFPMNRELGYGTGYGIGPYGQVQIPATLMLVDGPKWLYSSIGGGAILGHMQASDGYPQSATALMPFISLGFGVDVR